MPRHRHPIPPCGPVPEGMMRVSADIPLEMWEQLRAASGRRGVDIRQLIGAALLFAATA